MLNFFLAAALIWNMDKGLVYPLTLMLLYSPLETNPTVFVMNSVYSNYNSKFTIHTHVSVNHSSDDPVEDSSHLRNTNTSVRETLYGQCIWLLRPGFCADQHYEDVCCCCPLTFIQP